LIVKQPKAPMIGISRQTDYAARLVLHLACLEPGVRVSIPEIARTRLLPAPFTRRLIALLIRAGILQTTRGTHGGVSLARPAPEISLLDILEALEGGVVLNDCLAGGEPCVFGPGCTVQRAWGRASTLLRDHLASVTFDQLASGSLHPRAAHSNLAGETRSRRPSHS
jgi:Rrf2 family protein